MSPVMMAINSSSLTVTGKYYFVFNIRNRLKNTAHNFYNSNWIFCEVLYLAKFYHLISTAKNVLFYLNIIVVNSKMAKKKQKNKKRGDKRCTGFLKSKCKKLHLLKTKAALSSLFEFHYLSFFQYYKILTFSIPIPIKFINHSTQLLVCHIFTKLSVDNKI